MRIFTEQLLNNVWRKTPVFTPSNIKVFEFESLIRKQDNSFDEEACFGIYFFVLSFLGESVWYKAFRSAWYFGGSYFVKIWVFKVLLLHTETDRGTSCSKKREMENNEKSIDFYELWAQFGCQNVSSLGPKTSFYV